MSKEKQLEFTGERFTPECVREIWYEHYHRYAFAKNFVEGKKVLDAACGEGYGSNILAQNAQQVTGVDIDKTTIDHATQKYKKSNLIYTQASCVSLPFEDSSFNVIVSFETLEHLAEHEQMLAELNRVLTDDGMILISTPDKKHYSDATGFSNEYHVKELYKNEFKSLLDKHWEFQSWYSQAMAFQSLFEKHNSNSKIYSTDILNQKDELEKDQQTLTPMYYVVVASKVSINQLNLPDMHVFSDKQQSVYEHYNKTIKDFIYLANKHNALIKKHDKWLSLPILGKIIKFLDKRQ